MDQVNGVNGKKHKIIIALLVFFVVAGLGGGAWWWYYTTKYVTTDDARISGTIVNVSAKISGKVVELLVKEGDQVKAGQIIARIDNREILAQKAQAEAALAAAKARYEEVVAGARPQEIEQARAALDQARANLDNAQKNYERMEKLYKDGAISAAQRDNAETAYAVAREAYNAASEKLDLTIAGAREETIRAAAAQVKQAEAALEAANVMADNTVVVAPVSGSVALKAVNPGEVVAAGQPIVSIVDPSDLWVNARIEETKIDRIKIGQKVEYTIDSYPGRVFTGTVYDIGTATNSVFAIIPTENASGNFTKVTQRIPIKITLPKDSPYIFRPGASVIIKVHTD
ncbi:secretion protein HlyD family protein [Thermosinus carboxydivorans Nor1]|uniref:Secretion protein HlyD family protein n=1 Tax=Thermosinus carboxydivorans Nor1 TaxID=401526 RepID=A1HMI0_9FIRM|nr:HlyD family secretion protein [Thermosinus carboxydivorans]EAX49020.1 secretion protein HlyD family protein [Thermosinus carboxydivorans Nor1]